MAGFGWLAVVEADRRQGASKAENYGRGPWQEGLRNSTLYVTLVALQYKYILAIVGQYRCKRPTGDSLAHTQRGSSKSYSEGQNTKGSRSGTRTDSYINQGTYTKGSGGKGTIK